MMPVGAGMLVAAAVLAFSGVRADASCNYSISPTSRTHGNGTTNNSVGVSTALGCVWGVTNNVSWITILSPLSNTNSGTVNYTVAANPGLNSRTGTVMIAGQPFTVRQNGINCSYSISPELRPHGHGATNNTFSVMTADVCSWTASSTSSWLRVISGASGLGAGVVGYAVDANPSFEERTDVITIVDQVFTVTQRGMPCSYSITPGTRMHGYGTATNTVLLTTSDACAWTNTPVSNWISIVPSGMGTSNVTYILEANPYIVGRTGTVLVAGELFTLIQAASPGGPCVYVISPKSRSHGYGAASNYVRVSVPAGCFWTVQNTNTWISILPGFSGVANDDVGYLVDANPSMMSRTGVVTVANQIFTVRQDGAPCTIAIAPKSRMHGYAGSSNFVRVPLPNECAWSVQNTNSWLTIVPGYSGLGSADVGYIVASNGVMLARTGIVTIASQSFTVTQSGFTNVCTYSIQPDRRMHGYGATSNVISVTAGPACTWFVQNTNSWITLLSNNSGTGTGSVTYAVSANLSAGDRTGMVMVADQMVTLSQRGTTNTIVFEAIISIAPGQVKVSLTGVPGAVWELQGSPDLQLWEKISNITNTTGTVEYTDVVPAVSNRRFYRAILP